MKGWNCALLPTTSQKCKHYSPHFHTVHDSLVKHCFKKGGNSIFDNVHKFQTQSQNSDKNLHANIKNNHYRYSEEAFWMRTETFSRNLKTSSHVFQAPEMIILIFPIMLVCKLTSEPVKMDRLKKTISGSPKYLMH